jgi:TatD DNase family protein
MLIDCHTHLDHCPEDPAELVADARGAGVGLIVQCGTDLKRSRRSIELAERFPEVVAAVGYHPHEAANIEDAGFAEVEGWTAHPRVIAVGETGLDYYRDHCPHDVQSEAFVRQLDLARRAALPVVVHTREAADDTLAVLAEHALGLTVILHCFSLPGRLGELVERGYFLSFAGNVTYKNAVDLQEAAKATPIDRLLLETDAPWLTPVPLRGTSNRPGLVAKTYEFVAGQRGMTVQELAEQVETNARRAFPRLVALLGEQA